MEQNTVGIFETTKYCPFCNKYYKSKNGCLCGTDHKVESEVN